MNVELKRIAEKKIEQLGGDVCGVLVRKDGKLAAVDEHGRVQWLQDGQGAEPVVDIGTQEREGFWQQPIDKYTQPAQQGSVPEGWKLVPVEPTATMISAFEHAPCAENYTDAATWAWEAMLDATPQPPQEGSGDE